MGLKEKKITIKDIASIAGVSKGTVSRVINNIEGVGPETRVRIKKLIKDLNYQPNAFARGLAEQKTRNVGIIIPHEPGYFLSNDYWPSLLSSVSRYVVNMGYSIVVSTTYVEGEVEYAYQSILVGNKVDGLIIGSEMVGAEQIKNLIKQDMPFVMIGKSPYYDHYYADIDNTEAMRSLSEHVLNQGYKRLLYITGPSIYPNVKEKIKGFNQALKKGGAVTGKVICTPYHKPDLQQIEQEIIAVYKPDAVILGAGDFVLKVLKMLKHLKIRIPQDLGLACFDTLDFFDVYSPGITSIRQPLEELGKAAGEMLFARLSGQAIQDDHRVLRCSLEVRESCNESGSC